MAATYPSESMSTRHAHRRGQFILQTAGVTSMMTERGNFVIPPGHGLWIPAGIVHQSRAWADVEIQTIYIEPDQVPSYPATCRLIRASSLLEALMDEAVRMPVDYDEEGRDGQLVDLLLGEIGRMPEVLLHVPIPLGSAARPDLRSCHRRHQLRPYPRRLGRSQRPQPAHPDAAVPP